MVPDVWSLPPGTALIPFAPDEVQIGDGPRGLRLSGVKAAEIDLLCWLRNPVSAADLLGHGGRLGVDPERTLELFAVLQRAGAVSRPAAPGADAPVLVSGLGPCGLRLARRVAEAGFPVTLSDANRVGWDDLGPDGYPGAALGMVRELAAARELGGPDAQVGAPTRRPSMVIVVRPHGLTLADVAGFMNSDVAHLPVVIGAGTATVGPLVVPGRTCCLRCVELHRCDVDPGWASVVAGLGASAPTEPASPAHAGLRDVATGWAITTLASWAASETPWLAGRSVEVSLPAGAPLVRHWHPHRDCGCSLPMETIARPEANR